MKVKIDSLAWHGRVLNLLPISSVQEALMLFKKTLLPTDNANVRNGYIKFREHRSNGIVTLVTILKNEAMQEKMMLSSNTIKYPEADGPLFRAPTTENSNTQRKIF